MFGKSTTCFKKELNGLICFTFLKRCRISRNGFIYSTGLGDNKDELFAVLAMGISTEMDQ